MIPIPPGRTGIPTIRRLLSKICDLLNRYRMVIYSIVPSDKHVYVDALMKACEDFLTHVQHPETQTPGFPSYPRDI